MSEDQATQMSFTTADILALQRHAAPATARAIAARMPLPAEPSKGYRLTLPYPPGVNHLYATVGRRRVKSARGRAYGQQAAAIALAAGVRPIAGPVAVYVTLYRPRKRGDTDGALKSLLDSLTGLAYADDEQVQEIHALRFEDRKSPRAEVVILPKGMES